MTVRLKEIETDVLVLGGGLAALRAALSARSTGARVLMLGKRLVGRSGSSTMTTGGYAAALPELNERDSSRLHYIDTIVGGAYLNDRSLVQALVDDAPARLRELWACGVPFRKRDGRYHLSPSGDHSQPRVFVPEHMRGIDLTLPLRKAVVASGVDMLEDHVALDLLRDDDRVVGAVALRAIGGDVVVISARATVLAAGGAGRMFSVTSNPAETCGGGYALAIRAGAALRDMEFIQFYPWRLIRPFKATRVPVQPSTFMIGARLYNSRGERFMEAYDPLKKETAARDISARGIADQIRKGLDIEGGVRLDVSDVNDEQFRFENSKVVDLLDPKKIDYREIPLVVAPEAHFFMGGVAIDDCGRTHLRGLYAAGESAGGLHGGNRLNSNSIPETQVFGHRAGLTAAGEVQGIARRADPKPIETVQELLERAGADDAEPHELTQLTTELRGVVDIELGIVRSGTGLQRALRSLDDLAGRAQVAPVSSVRAILARAELLDLLATARACAMSALYRTESRAAHYRDDFPATNSEWRRTVFYTDGRLMTKAIAGDADEATWEVARKAGASVQAGGEKEYVE